MYIIFVYQGRFLGESKTDHASAVLVNLCNHCLSVQCRTIQNFGEMAHGKDWQIPFKNTQNMRRLKTALAMLKILDFMF